MFVQAISRRLVGVVGVVGRNGGATSDFSTYVRSDDVAETVESLLQKAKDDNVRLPGGPKRPQPLNHTALMSMFNEVRHLELRNSTSDRETFAILKAYSLLGDAEAARRIFFFRRSLKHPIVTSNFDSHIDDDLTLYLRSMTTVSARKGTREDGRLAVHLNESFFDSKYRPAQVMADVFKIIKYEKIPLTTNHANLMLGIYDMALKRSRKRDSKRAQKEKEFLLDGVLDLLSDFENGNEEMSSVRLDTVSYNTVVNCCCTAKDPICGLEFLHGRMKTHPNHVTFNILMWSFAKIGDAQSCEDIMTMMANYNVRPDSSTVNAVVQANLLCNNMAGAISGVQSIWNQYQVLPGVHNARKILVHGLSKRERGRSEFECRRWINLVRQILESRDWIDFGSEVNEKQHAYWCNASSLSAGKISDIFSDAGIQLAEEELWGEEFGKGDGKIRVNGKVGRGWLRGTDAVGTG